MFVAWIEIAPEASSKDSASLGKRASPQSERCLNWINNARV